MELIIVVRQLERMREDLQAALRHKIWSPERDKASRAERDTRLSSAAPSLTMPTFSALITNICLITTHVVHKKSASFTRIYFYILQDFKNNLCFF